MLFNSIPFLIFFAIVYLVYWNIPSKFRSRFLIISGFVFYGYFSIPFLFHFLFAIIVNYFLYYKIKTGTSGVYVKLSVILNLLNLGFFKYFYFFTKFLGDITGNDAFSRAPELVTITLPLAISFYSFQMIAASIDAHRNKEGEIISFEKYLLFVIFFPVLIAGPIMRTTDFFPNLSRTAPEKDHVYRACFLMMTGLIKKILIADPIAGRILPVYGNPDEYSSLTLVLAGITYSLQVYADFSGLTDMARSVALFLGFEIPENFAAPFFTVSGRELWQKWHMTLSFWLRDYIYFALGGNRRGEFRTYINLIITMTLGGFWHGADYTFIAWGAFWGMILASERFLEDKLNIPLTPQKNIFLKIIKAIIIFLLFSISALMFRSNSGTLMVDLFKGLFINSRDYLQKIMVSSGGEWLVNGMNLVTGDPSFEMNSLKNLESFIYMFLMVVFFHYIQFRPGAFDGLKKYRFPVVVVAGVATVFLITTLSQDGDAFIYYKF